MKTIGSTLPVLQGEASDAHTVKLVPGQVFGSSKTLPTVRVVAIMTRDWLAVGH